MYPPHPPTPSVLLAAKDDGFFLRGQKSYRYIHKLRYRISNKYYSEPNG